MAASSHLNRCARGQARSAVQRSLRVRNSPTCTLSQNGYGDRTVGINGGTCVRPMRFALGARITSHVHVFGLLQAFCNEFGKHILPMIWARCNKRGHQNSATGTRTRVARVRAEYFYQLDYSGSALHALAQTNARAPEAKPYLSLQFWRKCCLKFLRCCSIWKAWISERNQQANRQSKSGHTGD